MKKETGQQKIMRLLKDGGVLRCTEGRHYKTWVIMPDGIIYSFQRRSADKFCFENESKLKFGQSGCGAFGEISLRK